MTRVLITGGAGFIGTALARRLVAAATDRPTVTVMDNLLDQVHPTRRPPAELERVAQWLPLDVRDPDAWDLALRAAQPDTVIHLAAETGTGQSLTEASRHAGVNVGGTAQMLDALMRNDVRPAKLILASSRAVYGEGMWSQDGSAAGSEAVLPDIRAHSELEAGRWEPWARDTGALAPVGHDASRVPARPANIYATTKLAQEHLCQAWCAATGTDLAVLRLQNVYGPGQAPTNPYTGIVVLFARLAAAGETIEVYEDGNILRDFVYIDDVVSAFAAVAAAGAPRLTAPLDIGSGHPVTVLELAQTIADLYGAPRPRITGAFRDGDVRAAYADVRRAAEALNWRPQTELKAGLVELATWLDARNGDASAPRRSSATAQSA